MIPNKYILFLILFLFTSCQKKSKNQLGQTLAVLNHEKAIRLHQYLQKEVANLEIAQKNIPSAITVSNTFSKTAVRKERLIQIEDFKKLIEKQERILAQQKNTLKNHTSKAMTIHEREAEYSKIRKDLKVIRAEVLGASLEINKLLTTYQFMKEKPSELASN